eukprot:CAMPEP_0113391292 /NCGR_PEP_ID=MMETSP0013_2-20120614/10631_1 /TAXON_ID=2843 ORGANISM="Skeletonema costatum, Strain 1716" /NCGR_SAMPLE_ID=MMETSP0013_2 /ASSEMBLY_ACC=CAM_ASM_000158 /LENGTH=64 /DNA_ID=CAMNT_0000274523 /DNA_START=71 /DNA_END=265 /DNA_ORIENTATION=- /assembly_acc=CAM_ASM_000158
MSPSSYQGSKSPSSYQASNYSYQYDEISADDLPAGEGEAYPTGCTACATAAWVDTLRFIQYLCM